MVGALTDPSADVETVLREANITSSAVLKGLSVVEKNASSVPTTRSIRIASSDTLAIHTLHGKTKTGELFEAGFRNPQLDICRNNRTKTINLLVLITTAPGHNNLRQAVRQTWGHFAGRTDIVMAFVVGRTSQALEEALTRENELYGDIIQSNCVDHYDNLTLKTLSMLEWIKTYCSEAKFILKTDDDMYINLPALLTFMEAKKSDRQMMYGRLAKGWKPVRAPGSKYYLDNLSYGKTVLPNFLTGPAYLMTGDVVSDLYKTAFDTPYLKLEDVFFTGVLAERLHIKRVGDLRFRNDLIKMTDTCLLVRTISIHSVRYDQQFDIYKRTLDGKTKC